MKEDHAIAASELERSHVVQKQDLLDTFEKQELVWKAKITSLQTQINEEAELHARETQR